LNAIIGLLGEDVEVTRTAVAKDAVLSPCGLYRYSLTRTWDSKLPPVVFIGLNPSTADASLDDPTIRRCIRFGRDFGGGSLRMLNLFAFRATQPEDMRRAEDPCGPDNDHWLLAAAADAARGAVLAIAAWGVHGTLHGRDQQVVRMFGPHLKQLGLTKDRHPRHPLYLPASVRPQPYLAGAR
jgi:hypothetical protein